MPFTGSSTLAGSSVVTRRTYNVAVPSANTEVSLALPPSVAGYLVRCRDKAELKLSHVATESGTLYLTIPKTATHVDDHSYSNVTLYFQSPTAGVTVEVVAWET